MVTASAARAGSSNLSRPHRAPARRCRDWLAARLEELDAGDIPALRTAGGPPVAATWTTPPPTTRAV